MMRSGGTHRQNRHGRRSSGRPCAPSAPPRTRGFTPTTTTRRTSMSAAVSSRPASTPEPGTGAFQQPADVFVIFGITGDLAEVMTFHSLYRLEQRGLLDCPIVGVAVSDWSADDL